MMYKYINQGFTQALSQSSVFHKRLSFNTVGHNPTSISMLFKASFSFFKDVL